MKRHRIFSFVVAAIVLPAIAFAQKTTYDYDKTAVFAQFKTYSTKDGTPTGNPLIDKRIAASIEAQLAAKGFVRNDSSPDVFVLYHVAFDQQKDISTYSTGPVYGGYGWGWGGGWGTTSTDVRVRDILVGTLAIDIVDAQKERSHGVVSARKRSTPMRSPRSATRTSPRRWQRCSGTIPRR